MRKIKGFKLAKKELDRSQQVKAGLAKNLESLAVEKTVKVIINEVIERGDKALFEYTYKFDHVNLGRFQVTDAEISAAYQKVNKRLVEELKFASKRIADFHKICKDQINLEFEHEGLGRRIGPLNRIGIYVPGGTAAYPSTVLMTAIPAKVAGVREIIMVSPPQKDGSLPAPTLVAADLAKVNKIYKVGGAHAIAALAYGTETIPNVDKICGPGNIYVATAKKLVYGIVDIDGIQGPSEIIVVADAKANPVYCAADLIAQSEHDELAQAVFITDSEKLASDIEENINVQIKKLSRKKIISSSLKNRGIVVIVDNISDAIKLVNLYAPEHLLLMISKPEKYLPEIMNAGCIFIGENSPVVLGDYIAGPSHVLPTGGTARFSSPLSIETFLKAMNLVALTKAQKNKLAPLVIDLAEAEGLDGHANALYVRSYARGKK